MQWKDKSILSFNCKLFIIFTIIMLKVISIIIFDWLSILEDFTITMHSHSSNKNIYFLLSQIKKEKKITLTKKVS